MRWILEPDVFSPEHDQEMAAAIKAAGHSVTWWDDEWLEGRHPGFPAFEGLVMFHGSLGNAAEIASRRPDWVFCKTEAFNCSTWYPKAHFWRLQKDYAILPASALVADPKAVLDRFGVDKLFVRPDSPLKPFSGRVLLGDSITLKNLDHGFYYEDENIPVVVSPVQYVGREYRFIVVNQKIVAGSAYMADSRTAADIPIPDFYRNVAADIAQALPSPERVYVLDLCESEQGLRLLEINPFSGADLYGCDLNAVVKAVSAVVEKCA